MLDCFGDSVDASYFDWKYLQNPAGPAIGKIARAGDGEIAAFYGMIPEIYRFGGAERRIYQSCDTMTHSRHRRKGLFQSLAKAAYDEAQRDDPDFLAFGFGGPTSTPGFLKMGWRTEFELFHRFRPFPLTYWSPAAGRADRARSAALDQRLTSLIAASGDPVDGIRKDEAFVRWRLANPLRTYEYLVDDGAYAIFRQQAGSLFLFDLWEAEPRAARNVWAALLAVSRRQKSKGILTFCQAGTDYDRLLGSYGLMRNPLKRGPASATIPFITFGAQPAGAGAGAWTITPFDHDSL